LSVILLLFVEIWTFKQNQKSKVAIIVHKFWRRYV